MFRMSQLKLPANLWLVCKNKVEFYRNLADQNEVTD